MNFIAEMQILKRHKARLERDVEKLQAENEKCKAALKNMLCCGCIYCKNHAEQALEGGEK